MKRLHRVYMCFWIVVAFVLLGAASFADDKDAGGVAVVPMVGVVWNYARSRGRSPAWVLLGCWSFILLPLFKDLSSESSGPPPLPQSAPGAFAYTVGDPVMRGLEWLYEKIRYHPRDPDPPPTAPQPPTSS